MPTVTKSVVPSPSNLFQPITSVKTLASTASKPLARSNKTFSYTATPLTSYIGYQMIFNYRTKYLINKIEINEVNNRNL